MKLTFAVLFIACMHVAAAGHGQDRITLKMRSAELKKVLLSIEKKTDYRFLFNEALVSNKPKVDVDAVDKPVIDLLNELFQNIGISYKLFENKLVVLKETSKQGDLDVIKDIRVTGKVSSATGEGLPGVSVQVKGSRLGTTTDASGNFALTVPDNAVLIFSSVGYESRKWQ